MSFDEVLKLYKTKTCIKLRGATDFKKALHEVITDIRDVCGADECCVLYLDDDAKQCAMRIRRCMRIKNASTLKIPIWSTASNYCSWILAVTARI